MKRLLSRLLSLLVLCTSLTAVNTDDFALIPGGSFQMGDALDGMSDAPVVTVNVSAFYMGQYEVTKAEWDEVRTWGLSNGYTDLPSGSGKAADHPVHSINWYAMVKWCNARSEQEGRTPCYTVSGSTYRTGSSYGVVCDWTATGYRLPTEAEWEKAARGGLTGKRFPWGDTISHANANYYERTSYSYDVGDGSGYHPDYDSGATPYTSPVGSFAANDYGLYDMTGNVWEWCWDWYAGSYSDGATDPRGAASGSIRVLRGGSWNSSANYCRLARRNGNGSGPGYSNDYRGFRVALSFGTTTDTDGDGLVDSVETNTGIYVSETDTGTDPNNADTDNDGVPDGAEVNTHSSNPNLSDTDSDNLSDADEINSHLTNPNLADTDSDGLNDGDEINTHSTDPLASDSSGDGLSDGFVVSAGFAPNTDYSNLFTKDALNALGYYASSQLEDARTGAVMIEATDSTATLQLQIERSEDLTNWTQHEDDLISVPIQMDGDKQFFRFAMPQE